jgi:hypothetical protein
VATRMNFKPMPQADVPRGRNGKHKEIVTRILSDLELLFGLLPEQLRYRRSGAADGRVVVQIDVDLRTAIGRCVCERHQPSIWHIAALERLPENDLAGAIVDDLSVPFHNAARSIDDPMRTPVSPHCHRMLWHQQQ